MIRFFSIALLFVVAWLIALPSVSVAQDSYQWTDRNGRVFYGSTPPKNAVSVTRLQTKALSRYSSDKMLHRLGWKNQSTTKASDSTKKSVAPVHPAKLTAGEVKLDISPEGKVSSCTVPVQNSGESSANEISIAFDFPDGTLVPGVGPNTIAPNSSADYSIPSELLPLPLHLDKTSDEQKANPTPKVVVHGVGE